MAIYENEFSNFPQKKITLHKFKDVDDSIAGVINQINSLRTQGLYNQAQRIIEKNRDVLGQYFVDSTVINTIEEEIRNTQIYALQQQQAIFFDVNEPECQSGDVWIGGE